jgi:hypothetical protein
VIVEQQFSVYRCSEPLIKKGLAYEAAIVVHSDRCGTGA